MRYIRHVRIAEAPAVRYVRNVRIAEAPAVRYVRFMRYVGYVRIAEAPAVRVSARPPIYCCEWHTRGIHVQRSCIASAALRSAAWSWSTVCSCVFVSVRVCSYLFVSVSRCMMHKCRGAVAAARTSERGGLHLWHPRDEPSQLGLGDRAQVVAVHPHLRYNARAERLSG